MEDENIDFKFSVDEERPDTILQDETKDSRIGKLSRRITLLSILITLLIGTVLSVAYFDLRNRIGKISDPETTGISKLSKDLESSFSSLSIKQAKLEDLLNKKISGIENKISSLKAKLRQAGKRIDKTVKQIESLKTGEKDMDKAFGQFEKTLDPIRKDLGKTQSKIKNIDKRFKQDLAKLAGAVNSANNELEKLIESTDNTDKKIKIIKGKITGALDKKTLDLQLIKERKSYLKLLLQMRYDLEGKIEALQEKLNDFEKK